MHFALHKLPPTSHPSHRLLRNYYLSYTSLICFLQIYLIFAIVYHGRLLGMPFDPTFVFHIFLTWVTTVGSIGRFIEHVRIKDFEEYMKYMREETLVGRFDGVFSGIWLLPYTMIPFALFGDFRYTGLTWGIPIPMVLGYATSRWLYRRINDTYHTGEYAKLATDEEDVLDNDGLPAYEEHERSPSPPFIPTITSTTATTITTTPSSFPTQTVPVPVVPGVTSTSHGQEQV
ncbi:hypothetical protein TWF569_011322 [Orbilia oligospora]|uniref:Uncharacterized protein n=2 Tax=Orbilia oligospora TaxID=2813651 RepID=A0A7C8NP31_ORBOL|nr:hypothetical protein TWF706_009047 [Orbilia oligospora]KAF3097581.1 hypothetical protein TWF103_009514 [Orbilia oligospora]KAF3098115.1 hypothetical protein TWF102_006109 [Orbilia oligospora]KAF3151411.1 hypothetical protein TWF594_007058 [Orbilia oligospora]KAF3154665.1 hypothetical protein TWF569_011322 [Orbilia oligospora]